MGNKFVAEREKKWEPNSRGALGIQRVFVRYSRVFGMVFRVFGILAHLQILQIPHPALFPIPTNYSFYNINRGESGNQGGRRGGPASPRTRPYHFLELIEVTMEIRGVTGVLGLPRAPGHITF